MIKIQQEFMHDIEKEIPGDCHRACIASIFELPLSEVPHFYRLAFTRPNDYSEIGTENLTRFLEKFGVFQLTVPAVGWDINEWVAGMFIKRNIYHIISDQSPRFKDYFHSVVGCNGKQVWDPHPEAKEPLPVTDKRTFDFFVKYL